MESAISFMETHCSSVMSPCITCMFSMMLSTELLLHFGHVEHKAINYFLDLVSRIRRFHCEALYLGRYYRKASSVFPGSWSLYGCVDREYVGLPCYMVYGFKDRLDKLRFSCMFFSFISLDFSRVRFSLSVTLSILCESISVISQVLLLSRDWSDAWAESCCVFSDISELAVLNSYMDMFITDDAASSPDEADFMFEVMDLIVSVIWLKEWARSPISSLLFTLTGSMWRFFPATWLEAAAILETGPRIF